MSRHEILARRWRAVAWCAAYAVIGVVIAVDFGVVPKSFMKEHKLAGLPPLVALAVCFAACMKIISHTSEYCAKCGRTIQSRKYSGALPDKQWWVVAICEDCVREEDFLLSLPNREHSHENEALAARWTRWLSPSVFTALVGAIGCWILDTGVAHGIATLVCFGALAAFITILRWSIFYGMSFCVHCKRDFEQYETRMPNPKKLGSYICERCSDGSAEYAEGGYGSDQPDEDEDDENGEEVGCS